jgi:hypothetical protein
VSVSSASINLLQMLLGGEHALVGREQRGEVRVRVGERDLDQGSLAGQRRAQLVRGVGDKLTLRLERSVEPRKQVIEGVPEFLELVLGAVEGQALVQTGGGDPSGRAGDGPDRSQHPAGNQPAGQDGEYGHDRQSDSRVDQKLVRVGSALCCLNGPCLCHLMHSVRQLMHGLCQLMLVLRQLMLLLCQLRHRQFQLKCWSLVRHRQRQLTLVLGQLTLDLIQTRQSLCQRKRKLGKRKLGKRKLEMLDGGSVRDLR